MKQTQHSNRSTGASIRAITLALLVVLSVWATAPAAAAQQHPAATVDTAAATGELAIDVTQHDDGSATVTVTENGSASAGANLTVETLDGNSSYDGVGEYVTDENGTVGLPAPSEDLEIEVTAEYEGSTAETTAFLDAFEGFQVTIDATTSPVTEGDPLTVTATVENTGDEAATQEITLPVGGEVRDATNVTLSGGESTTVELTWETGAGDAGDHRATVASEDDADSSSVTVLDSANFSVSIDSTNSPVVEGETLFVNATITNTGDDEGEQTVRLRSVGGQSPFTLQNTSIALEPGESDTVTFTWTTGDGDAGEYLATVASEDDAENTSVVVEPSASGSANLAVDSGVVETYRGDVAEIGVYLNATNTTTLTIGSEDQRYQASVTVTDGDGDGTVTVLWNTHLAGKSDDASVEFDTAGEADSIASADRTIDQAGTTIDAGSYQLSVTVGDEETDRGMVSVFAPLAVNRTIGASSAPSTMSPSARMAEFAANVSATGEIVVAEGDWLVLEIRAVGIHGYVDGADDLAGDGTQGVWLSIEETSLGPNEEADTVTMDSFHTLGGEFPMNGSAVFTADTSGDDFELGETYEATFVIDGENPYVDSRVERTAAFTVEAPSVTITPADDRVRTPNTSGASIGGTTNLADGTELTVTIRSTGENVADGQPFSQTRSATVRNNTVRTTFDLSGKPDGQSFTVTVRHGDTGELLAEREGVVTRPASVSMSGQISQNGQVLTAERAHLPSGGFVAVHRGSTDGPVVGVSEYLEPGPHQDVRIRLDEPIQGEVTLYPMVHWDNDGDGEFDFDASVSDIDGPYTQDGSPVVDSMTVSVGGDNEPPTASIASNTVRNNTVTFDGTNSTDPDGNVTGYEWRVDGEVVSTSASFEHTFEEPGEHEVTLRVTDDDGATATATRTVEVSPPDTATERDDIDAPTGAETPGFGPAAGLVALASVALLYRRRG